jgi:hypothetical protein
MTFNFKKFENRNARQEDRITVTKSNAFGFPMKFYQVQKLADVKYAILYFDESVKAIGIQFTNDEVEKNKFSLIKSKKGYGGSIVARSFFKTYNLDPLKYHGRYDWKIVNQEGIGKLYVINLKERQETP